MASAILDANVLIPAALRDTLLRLAEFGLYEPLWSAHILEEVCSNLVEHAMARERNAARLLDTMRVAFPEAEVTGYESLIDEMPNDPKDRHVLAAAVVAGSQTIVTHNLRHFPPRIPFDLPVSAQSPDVFLSALLVENADVVVQVIHEQARHLEQPRLTPADVVRSLAIHAPTFATRVATIMTA